MKYNKLAFNSFLPDGYDGEFDWDYLTEIWGLGIEPMDFDCVVEKGGEFLVIETKGPNGYMERGQKRTFLHLIKDPKWTLMVLYGKLPAEVEEIFIYRNGREIKHIKPATKDDVKRECQSWADRRQSRYIEGKIGR